MPNVMAALPNIGGALCCERRGTVLLKDEEHMLDI